MKTKIYFYNNYIFDSQYFIDILIKKEFFTCFTNESLVNYKIENKLYMNNLIKFK